MSATRRIPISGAAGGIGSATARLCSEHGARLVLIDLVSVDRTRDRVGERAASVAEIYSLDTGSRQEVTKVSREIGSVFGLIDTAAIALLDDSMAEDWDDALEQVIRANIKGPINLTRAFLPAMIENGEGRIFLIGNNVQPVGGAPLGSSSQGLRLKFLADQETRRDRRHCSIPVRCRRWLCVRHHIRHQRRNSFPLNTARAPARSPGCFNATDAIAVVPGPRTRVPAAPRGQKGSSRIAGMRVR